MVGHFLGTTGQAGSDAGSGRVVHVALLGDADLVREGLLAMCLRRPTSIKLVDCEAQDSAIDLLLVDPWQQRWTTGDELAQVRARLRARQVVCFSWKSDREARAAAVGMGFDGYLSKQTPTRLLVDMLLGMFPQSSGASAVPRDGRSFPSAASQADPRWARSLSRCPGGLTPRELDVVLLVMDGLSNEEIGRRLYLSSNTVKSYIRTAYHKMGVNSRAQAVRWGCENLLSKSFITTNRSASAAAGGSPTSRIAS